MEAEIDHALEERHRMKTYDTTFFSRVLSSE